MNEITRMCFLQNERFLGKVDLNQWLGHDKLTFNDSISSLTSIRKFLGPTPSAISGENPKT